MSHPPPNPPPSGPLPSGLPPCPKCGGLSFRTGPWPWYLGTIGAMICKPVICNGCGHEFDTKKPEAHLPSRKRNLAIVINAIGGIGIIIVVVLIVLMIMNAMK